jgi:aminomethyltransferase
MVPRGIVSDHHLRRGMHKTPLYNEHLDRGAKVVDFNGWALPLQFRGIVEEHHHTRTAASIFDCSHMGEYRVRGKEAILRYDREIISDVSTIPVGRCRYGAVLTEEGGILDDLITFRMSEDELYVVTNAGPLDVVTERFCAGAYGAEHVSFETAKIDIQGPTARDVALAAGFEAARTLKYFNAVWTEWRGKPIVFSRTGYTGELGYEIFMDNALAPEIWNALIDIEGVEPAGLGARDTLRTEVGYGLSGQDFDSSITPLEAGMESFIAWDTEFTGKAALEKMRAEKHWQVLVGIQSNSRRAPRHGFELWDNDTRAGVVTSGTFGPSVEQGIGLARVDEAYATPGTILEAGPKRLEVEVAKVPFYTKGTCRVQV